MAQGKFVSFEGIEGSGKSTQLRRLAAVLASEQREVVVTKEPGGTPLSDRIRAILLDPHETKMDPMTEMFLLAAARRQHVAEVVRPALERGAYVLCDRFTDATLAYQGFGRLLSLDLLRELNDLATDGLYPDVTFIFDLPETVGVLRARARNEESAALQSESRIDGEEMVFHRRVREGYLALATGDRRRYQVIDANGSIDEVATRTLAAWRDCADRVSA